MKIELPIELGQEVFIVPSEKNYRLNIINRMEALNKICRQHISDITINSSGWYVTCDLDKEFGTGLVLLEQGLNETWFLSEDKAIKKIEELEEDSSFLRE